MVHDERYVVKEEQPAKYKLKPAKYANISEDDLDKMISVSNAQNSQVFTVNVRDTDPVRAKDVANEIAKVFKAKIASIMSVSNVSIVSRATADPTPVTPNLKIASLIGLILGMVLAFTVGLIRELTDQTIKSIDFITNDLGLVNLGLVNYVQRMNDMDEAIARSKNKIIDSEAEPETTGFPQRSRRRV